MRGFDLNRAVGRWRRDLVRREAFDSAALDELESHLWDAIEAAEADGLPPRQAFLRATAQLGHEAVLAFEYRKVTFWSPERPWSQEIRYALAMLQNYFLIAFRALAKRKVYAGLNIVGLALGLACTGALLLFVHYEFSYDRHHENADRIRRVIVQQPGNEFMGSDFFAVTPAPLAGLIDEAVPQAEAVTAANPRGSQWLETEAGQRFYGTNMLSDNQIFDVFDVPLIQGNIEEALLQNDDLVLTKSMAERMFGETSPLGQVLTFQDGEPATVVAVVADPPPTSSLQYEYITPLIRSENFRNSLDSWSNSSFATYVLVQQGISPSDFDRALRAAVAPHMTDLPREYIYNTEALTDIRLHTRDAFRADGIVSYRMLLMLLVVAGLILLIACTNYVNMATAQLALRTREVGVRKVMGAHRQQVMVQFLSEAALMVFVSIVLGIMLLAAALPALNNLLGTTLTTTPIFSGVGFGILGGLLVLTTLLAGAYPSFLLARLQPVRILKGSGLRGRRHPVRNTLVTLQFAAVIVLGSVSLLIFQQLQYANSKPLGFDRSYVFTTNLRSTGMTEADRTRVMEVLRQETSITNVALGSSSPFNVGSQSGMDTWDNKPEGAEDVRAYQISTDAAYVGMYEIPVRAGRAFDPNRDVVSDDDETPSPALINESLVQLFGWTNDEAIGMRFGYDEEYNYPGMEVVGVIADFHAHSLHLPIAPLFMRYNNSMWLSLHVEAAPGRFEDAVAAVEAQVKAFAPSVNFSYEFADDAYAEMYAAERQTGTLISIFALFTVLIACLGLGGLSAFIAQQRTAEVGLRKALGASTGQILALFSKDLLRLSLIAFVLGAPLAWWLVDAWLEAFAYRIDINVVPFIIVGVLACSAALLAASFPAFRAARVNPAETLRTE